MFPSKSKRQWLTSLSPLLLVGLAANDLRAQNAFLQDRPRLRWTVANLVEEKAPPAAKAPTAEDQKKLQSLLTERRDVLKEAFEVRSKRVKDGLDALSGDLLDTSLLLLQAELELIDKPDDRIAAHEKHVKLAKETDSYYGFAFRIGKIPGDKLKKVQAARLAAEIDLLRVKTGGKPSAEQAAEIKKLLEARRDVMREEVEARESRIKAGIETLNVDLLEASSRLLQAELELTDKAADRIAAHEKHVKLAKETDAYFERVSKAGTLRVDACKKVQAARLAAETNLLREKAGGKPSPNQKAAIKKVLEACRDALRDEVEAKEERVKAGNESSHLDLMDAFRRFLLAELELTQKPDERIAAHQKYVEIAKENQSGKTRVEYYLQTKAARLEA